MNAGWYVVERKDNSSQRTICHVRCGNPECAVTFIGNDACFSVKHLRQNYYIIFEVILYPVL